jgi:tetraacyldisaccharide 4'-kinase
MLHSILKPLLFFCSVLYGVIVFLRNKLFDFKIFKSKEFLLPVISVGNITVGGTGKTPHTEYLIRLLKDKYNVAFLSRGYKRKTRNFIVATAQSTVDVIGDEPLQIKRKFPEMIVAVDRKRVNGIQKLTGNIPDLDIILLDDAYQHRSVKPGINILLIDYNRPLKTDWMLPFGRLRESASEKKRADIIIVTKAPDDLSAMDKRLKILGIEPLSHQSVYFSTIKYGSILPVFKYQTGKITSDIHKEKSSVLLVTGIADPSQLIKELKSNYKEVFSLCFPDHHAFTQQDITSIIEKYNSIGENDKIIITTEKDAARLTPFGTPENIPEAWYYIPIEIELLPGDIDKFNQQILLYVNNNNKNSILHKK